MLTGKTRTYILFTTLLKLAEVGAGVMTNKPFDAGKYLTDLNGRDYLEVKWRLLWLRTEHPDAVIETELMKHEEGLALFRARVAIPAAGVSTGWGSETTDDFEDYIEKAETKALGRALAALGYGTQFCEDFDFSAQRGSDRRMRAAKSDARTGQAGPQQRVVDAPVSERGLRVVRDRRRGGATSSQLQAISSIARDLALGEGAVQERCRDTFGCAPSELSKRQASEFIDELKRPREATAAQMAHAAPSS